MVAVTRWRLSSEDVRASVASHLLAPFSGPDPGPGTRGSWLHDGSDALGREPVPALNPWR